MLGLGISLTELSARRQAYGPRFYVDSVLGDDSNDGLSPATPKATLTGLITASPPEPGSEILLARGGVYPPIALSGLNGEDGRPIRFGAYGIGANPNIRASADILGVTGDWTETAGGSNIWTRSYVPTIPVAASGTVADTPFRVYFNGVASPLKMAASQAGVTAPNMFFYNFTTDVLSVYSVGNPASTYTSLRATNKNNSIINSSWLVIKDWDFTEGYMCLTLSAVTDFQTYRCRHAAGAQRAIEILTGCHRHYHEDGIYENMGPPVLPAIQNCHGIGCGKGGAPSTEDVSQIDFNRATVRNNAEDNVGCRSIHAFLSDTDEDEYTLRIRNSTLTGPSSTGGENAGIDVKAGKAVLIGNAISTGPGGNDCANTSHTSADGYDCLLYLRNNDIDARGGTQTALRAESKGRIISKYNRYRGNRTGVLVSLTIDTGYAWQSHGPCSFSYDIFWISGSDVINEMLTSRPKNITEAALVSIDHCTFVFGSSANLGVAMLRLRPEAKVHVTNTLFHLETVAASKFGFLTDSGGTATQLTGNNNLLNRKNSTADYGRKEGVVLAAADVFGASGFNMANSIAAQDPMFTNLAAGDFTLLPGSPAIGAASDGTNIGAY